MYNEIMPEIPQADRHSCHLMLLRNDLSMNDFDFHIERSLSSSYLYQLEIRAKRTDNAHWTVSHAQSSPQSILPDATITYAECLQPAHRVSFYGLAIDLQSYGIPLLVVAISKPSQFVCFGIETQEVKER